MITKQKKKLKPGILITVITSAVAFVVAVALIITNIFVPVKYLSAYCVIKKSPPENGTMRVTFLDVGYGDCTFIEFPDGKTLLIDGGDGSYPNTLKVLSLLNGYGIEEIDYLVCSSVSKERCGGLAEILKYKKVNNVYSPYCLASNLNYSFREFSYGLKRSVAEKKICEYGAGVFAEDYIFCFLTPSVHTNEGGEFDLLNREPTTENILNASATVWLEYKGTGFLLLGDGTGDSFSKLIKNYQDTGGFEINGKKIDLKSCKLIKAANHGAEISVCTKLYDFLKPQTAIMSVGGNNAGSPCNTAVADAQRYSMNGFYRTDYDGTVTVITDGNYFTVSAEK